jgi:hypothetical protein
VQPELAAPPQQQVTQKEHSERLSALGTELRVVQEQQATAPTRLDLAPANESLQEQATRSLEENAHMRTELERMQKERAAELEAAALAAAEKVQLAERLARQQEIEHSKLARQQAHHVSQARIAAAENDAAAATAAQTEALAKAALTVSAAQAQVVNERERLLKALQAEKERSAEVVAEYGKRVAAAESDRITKQAAMQRLQTEVEAAREACAKAETAAEHEGQCAAQEQALRQELQRKTSALHSTASQQHEALRRQLVSREEENIRLARQAERAERRRQSQESQMMTRLAAERYVCVSRVILIVSITQTLGCLACLTDHMYHARLSHLYVCIRDAPVGGRQWRPVRRLQSRKTVYTVTPDLT